MLNIVLFGPPGAGKGTQSKLILEKYNLIYISTGDILRSEIAAKSDLGLKAKDIIEKGGLVDDELIVQLIEHKIISNQNATGFLFDGFPRTFVQAYILGGLLQRLNTSLTCILSLNVPDNELIERLLKRATIEKRKDDTSEVINYRLNEYKTKTLSVANYYKEKGIFHNIKGSGDIQDIFKNLTTIIDASLKKVWTNIVLFGAPGAGKGTQGRLLAKKHNLGYISTSSLLREEINEQTEIGIAAKLFVKQGKMVPDEIVIKLIEREIERNKDAHGFIFKGFPRTLVQAYILDGLLRKASSSVSYVVEIEVPILELIKRLSARGKTDNSRVYDVNSDLIIERLEEYESVTKPVASYYSKHNKYKTVNGIGTSDQVFTRLSETIENALKHAR